MKKVLFLSLILSIGMMGFAQVPVKKGDIAKKAVVGQVLKSIGAETPEANVNNFTHEVMTRASEQHRLGDSIEDATTMTTVYDLQSNSALSNRIARWDDGSMAVVMTWGNDGNLGYSSNRGTGYNFYDGSAFGDEPEDRIEGSLYSGWPSIAPVGEGEIIASHGGNNVNIYKREVRGEGDWEQVAQLKDCTWPRIATTGDGQYVHVVCAEQDANNTLINYLYYSRSTDGGNTFPDIAYHPLIDVDGMYHNDISADDYVIATNGNTIAILCGSWTYDLFYVISHDNGETWEKQVIWNWPYDHALDWNNYNINSDTDTIWSPDGSHSMVIDDNGVVHVAFALGRHTPSADTQGSYSYWPLTVGIVYWNSEYVNEQGGHEIPNFGDWSGDAQFQATMSNNGVNGISNTLNDERIDALAAADGYQHLNIFGWPDENGDGVFDPTADGLWDNYADINRYRTLGLTTMPSITIDNHGNMAIMYSALSENRVHQEQQWYYRGAYLTFRDESGEWFYDAMCLNHDFVHRYEDVYYTTALPNGKDGDFWFAYQASNTPGLLIDDDGSPAELNPIYWVRITPSETSFWGVEEQEAINPMTSVRVYPNPATDVLNIEVNASQSSAMSINVYNIMGQKVMEQNVNVNAGVNVPTINTADFTSGIYFVTVKANGFENTMKFIVK